MKEGKCMMNVTGLGVNPTDNSQLAFKAKKPNRKQIHEFIDGMSDAAKNFQRPIPEQRETAMRNALLSLRLKCPFIGKIMKSSEANIEHITSAKNNKLIEFVDNAHRQAYLTELKQRNPELYKEVLRREALQKVAQMSNMQIVKEIIKGFFK